MLVIVTGALPLLLFIIFVVLLTRIRAAKFARSFRGTVTGHRHVRVMIPSGVANSYQLIVRSDKDDELICRVNRQVFESFGAGDRIVKHERERFPRREA